MNDEERSYQQMRYGLHLKEEYPSTVRKLHRQKQLNWLALSLGYLIGVITTILLTKGGL